MLKLCLWCPGAVLAMIATVMVMLILVMAIVVDIGNIAYYEYVVSVHETWFWI